MLRRKRQCGSIGKPIWNQYQIIESALTIIETPLVYPSTTLAATSRTVVGNNEVALSSRKNHSWDISNSNCNSISNCNGKNKNKSKKEKCGAANSTISYRKRLMKEDFDTAPVIPLRKMSVTSLEDLSAVRRKSWSSTTKRWGKGSLPVTSRGNRTEPHLLISLKWMHESSVYTFN